MGAEETTTATEKSMAATSEQQQKNVKEDVEEGEIVEAVNNLTITTPTIDVHQLENAWTFWFDTPSAKSKQSTWGSSMRPIYTFSTVQHFWGLYNNIHHPSKLGAGGDLYCFKQKIEPKWEDPICADGGKWTVAYSRGKLDTSWLYSLSIGRQWKKFLDYSDSIGFIFHDDAKKLDRAAKNRYTC